MEHVVQTSVKSVNEDADPKGSEMPNEITNKDREIKKQMKTLL